MEMIDLGDLYGSVLSECLALQGDLWGCWLQQGWSQPLGTCSKELALVLRPRVALC